MNGYDSFLLLRTTTVVCGEGTTPEINVTASARIKNSKTCGIGYLVYNFNLI